MSDTLKMKAESLAHATKALIQKQAAEKSAYAENVATTVDFLIKAGSAKSEDRDSLVSALSENPSKSLEIMSKLAEQNRNVTAKLQEKTASAKEDKVESLGNPDDKHVKAASDGAKESDRIWNDTFGAGF